MKNYVKTAALSLSAMLALGSCGNSADAKTDALIGAVVSDAAAAGTSAPVPVAVPAEQISGSGDVDIDLTAMNSTMVYSVIYDMMINPDVYYGKSVIVDGYFDTAVNDLLGVQYYFVVVPDATACCAQGLEFKLDSTKKYPEDYPETAEDIRVKGVLDHYEEEGQEYSYIRVESLENL